MRTRDKVLIFVFLMAGLVMCLTVFDMKVDADAAEMLRQTTTEIDICETPDGLPSMCDFGGCPVAKPAPTTEAETEPTEAEAEAFVAVRAEEQAADISATPAVGESYLGAFKCTAYCGCYSCSEGYGNMTATGVQARAYHTIAVDPSVIPYGTWVVINGVRYRAEDCGGGVNGNHIDIFFDSHSECESFGVRYLDVYAG